VPLERFPFTSCPIAKPGSERKALQSEEITRTSIPFERCPLYSCSGDNPKYENFLLLSFSGLTAHSWSPWAIGHHGAPVSLPKLKKPMKKVPGASHGAPY
ncbi:unnamed protein product, partial [Staurois parvus]